MSINEPIRIISDLHLGHPSSALESVGQIAPLLNGASTVIFNGDSVEIHLVKRREQGLLNAAALRELCVKAGVSAYFVNGNHDPNLSDLHHVDLVGGAVLVTHGDMLFHDIAPWNVVTSKVMSDAHTAAIEELGEEAFYDFEKRQHASKRAALAIELHDDPFPRGPLAGIAFVLEELWPPWRPMQVIKCWAEAPGKAVALARVFRPRARIIIIGHTHRSGIWRIGPRIVINTGSFMPFAKRFVVDLEGATVRVKPILRRGGEFVIGKETAQFEATKIKAHEGY